MNFNTLARNIAVAFLAQGVSFFASIAMSLLVPKVLGVETYGYWQLFGFYASYSGFFMLGLNDGIYLIEGGKTRSLIDKKAIGSQFHFTIILQLIVASFIACIAIYTAPELQRRFVLFAFAFYTVLCNLSCFLGYVFQAINETRLFSYSTMIERFVFLAAILVLYFLELNYFEPYVFAYIFAKACSLIYCLVHSRDFIFSKKLRFLESLKLSLSSIKVGFPLMISNVASMLVLGVARALVDETWGIEAFGRVSFWLSMVNFFITFVSQASMVLFPALRQGTDAEQKTFYCGLRNMMELALPVVYLLYFPLALVLSMWLPQYAGSMHFLAILLPVCVFDTKMDLCCTTYFKVMREERTLLKVNLCTLFASAALSAIGVYVFNSLEAVLIGTVACIIGRSFFSEFYLNEKFSVSSGFVSFQEIALTVAFVALALSMPTIVAALAYFFLYGAYLFENRSITTDVLKRVRRMLARR